MAIRAGAQAEAEISKVVVQPPCEYGPVVQVKRGPDKVRPAADRRRPGRAPWTPVRPQPPMVGMMEPPAIVGCNVGERMPPYPNVAVRGEIAPITNPIGNKINIDDGIPIVTVIDIHPITVRFEIGKADRRRLFFNIYTSGIEPICDPSRALPVPLIEVVFTT